MKAIIKLDEADIKLALAEWVERKYRQKPGAVTLNGAGIEQGDRGDVVSRTITADVEVGEMPPKVRPRKAS